MGILAEMRKNQRILDPKKNPEELANRVGITGEGIDQMTYVETGAEIGELVERKNVAYGDSFNQSGEILKILYPNGVKPGEYKTLLAVTRILDKLFRIATNPEAFGENPWIDIAGYSILMVKQNDT